MTCERCDGERWMSVQPGYLDRYFPFPTFDPPRNDDEALAQAAVLADVEGKRIAALNSVYPCRDCNKDLFYRWAAGHLLTGHDPRDCVECKTAGVGSERRRRAKVGAGVGAEGGETVGWMGAPEPPSDYADDGPTI